MSILQLLYLILPQANTKIAANSNCIKNCLIVPKNPGNPLYMIPKDKIPAKKMKLNALG